MLFNSIQFALFLPIVFLLYWIVFDHLIRKSKFQLHIQNAFVVIASYLFYGLWDWRFLLLIAFTSFCSWGSGILIRKSNSPPKEKRWMWLNIVINVGILALFKYYDFFVSEFAQLFQISTDGLLLKVILPVGISFYTFQALSYSIDVYRKKVEPTNNIVAFFAFISFFPQLVAGPIERATNLLPQFLKKRKFNYATATDGMRQILWGFFKKVVVADNCAVYVDSVFSNITGQSGSTLLLAAIFFTFQIYGDFSGYSDIAIGTAKLFGIRLMQNFKTPYFSRDIAEFWRRWHISLTTWFRDYVYIPLGGSRVDKAKIIRNTLVIFLISGLWHGANWTFIAWGVYHAVLFMPLILMGRNRRYINNVAEGRILPTWRESGQMLLTLSLTMVGWIVFRSENIMQTVAYFYGILDMSLFSMPHLRTEHYLYLLFILFMLAVEWLQRDKSHGLQLNSKGNRWLKWLLYLILVILIEFYFLKSIGHPVHFIYFQF